MGLGKGPKAKLANEKYGWSLKDYWYYFRSVSTRVFCFKSKIIHSSDRLMTLKIAIGKW